MVTLRLVDNFRAELQRLNIDLIRGHGQFLDSRTLQVIDEHGLTGLRIPGHGGEAVDAPWLNRAPQTDSWLRCENLTRQGLNLPCEV
jgi:hypothetical protein